jgi:CRISPR-associated protein Csd1
MILQALTGYYARRSGENGTVIAAAGFENKEIPFVIVLNQKGGFVALQDTRELEGNVMRGRLVMVPKGVKKTSGIIANLLWDNSVYLLGLPRRSSKNDLHRQQKRAKELQQCFISRIREQFAEPIQDEGVQAVLAFLEQGNFEALFSHPAWDEIEESAPYMTFKLETDSCLVCQRPLVVASIAAVPEPKQEAEERSVCLVTGEIDIPSRLHTSIKGVRGAQSSGASIVSFNHDAFRWFGKEQGLNAPVGKGAEFAYTTALNSLLGRGSQQRLQLGEVSCVFWAERPTPLEHVFADLLKEPRKDDTGQSSVDVASLLQCATSGTPAQGEDLTPFFVLGLAPNAGRIAVRFWHTDTVANIVSNIKQHFDDCHVAHGPHQPAHLSLFRLLISTASLGKPENIQPNLAVDLLKAVISGSPYPQALLTSTIRRCRADGETSYCHAAIIKAVLLRQARFQKTAAGISVALDPTDTSAGYLLGRLFAVLERAEASAIRGLNLTIRDRFYSLASSTPASIFPHLMRLKNYHLALLDNKGVTSYLETLVGETMSELLDFPAKLSLPEQGRFALGCYQQRQSFLQLRRDGHEYCYRESL